MNTEELVDMLVGKALKESNGKGDPVTLRRVIQEAVIKKQAEGSLDEDMR
jgi:Asp-tRNA(Asn)/Glu-tRNA(Gln) amidotransferase B subunit